MDINWYPGHMARAKRLLQDQLSRVDVVVEVCDARLPRSSRNPDLERMTQNKQRVLLLNKADLADPAATNAWMARFRAQGIACASIIANQKCRDALSLIERAAQEKVARAKERGINKTVRAMVIGVPNVGKSTLINRLHGGSIAQVGDRPGITRANQWVKITPYLELLDTPGLLWPRLGDPVAARRLSYIAAIRDEVLDTQKLAMNLADDMMAVRPDAVVARYKIKNADARGYDLLEEMCRGRGFLLRGGELDTDRACAVLLDEFRAGKLGRITLEMPPKEEKRDAQSDGEAE